MKFYENKLLQSTQTDSATKCADHSNFPLANDSFIFPKIEIIFELIAKWNKKYYTITYDEQNGQKPNDQNHTHSQKTLYKMCCKFVFITKMRRIANNIFGKKGIFFANKKNVMFFLWLALVWRLPNKRSDYKCWPLCD